MHRGSLIFGMGTLAIVGLLLGCDKPDLKSDKGKYSYAIGLNQGKNLKSQNVELDEKSFRAGLKDALAGKPGQIPEEELMASLRTLSQSLQEKRAKSSEENIGKGQAFLDANKQKPDVKVTASGLQYKVIKEGTGKKPKPDDWVEVHYTGTFIDGKKFDSSLDRGEPAKFPVGGVIRGWTEALQLMKEGAEYDLVIPSDLAYGPEGNPNIPPNSVLAFNVQLIKIAPPDDGMHGMGKKPKGK